MAKILDYQEVKPTERMARRLKRVGIWLLIFVTILVAVQIIRIRRDLYEIKQSIRRFDESTSEAKLIGKTPKQIISLCGTPYLDTINDTRSWNRPEKDRLICYEGPWGELCRIEITDGVATKVEHYGK